MKKFRVFLRGEHFFLKEEGLVERYGFYTTRFVEALDEDQAEQTAVELVRKEDQLREAVWNDQPDPSMIFVEEIVEISTFESQGSGFSFYEEDPAAH